MRRLKSILDKAYIVENLNPGVVDIGTYVTIVAENKTEQTFRIVNTFESDLSKNQISSFSPLGKALMGKKINAKVSVNTPGGMKYYLITNLSISLL